MLISYEILEISYKLQKNKKKRNTGIRQELNIFNLEEEIKE
jgi:hypothetical protein